MPFSYNWVEIDRVLSEAAALRKIDGLRSLATYHSTSRRCTVCAINVDEHKMRYRVYYCSSTTCNTEGSPACTYWLKVKGCDPTGVNVFYTDGEHRSSGASPRRPAITRQMKDEIIRLIDQNYTPANIQHALIDTYSLNSTTVPPLDKIQNFVYYHKRTNQKNSDLVEDMVQLVGRHRYHSNLDEDTAFAFGYSLDGHGAPMVGEGTDADPCMIAVATKSMIRNADRPFSSFVWHMDATFKTNTVDYPVFVCGVSDIARHFHPVALFIISQRTKAQYEQALDRIATMFAVVVGRPLRVRYFMADAEDAQYNGYSMTLQRSDTTYLMCFYHVMEKVRTRIAGLTNHAKHLVFRHIYEMHYSRNYDEFVDFKNKALFAWSELSELADFTEYFVGQWLRTRYWAWQCFHSPSGFAKTNNPCEQFNKVIKSQCTLHVRSKLCTLLQKLLGLCHHKSVARVAFGDTPIVHKPLMTRFKTLLSKGKLLVSQPRREARVLDGGMHGGSDTMRVRGIYTIQDTRDDAKRGERNKNRMERWEEPVNGWSVNVEAQTCRCRAFFKYACCVHLMTALQSREMLLPGDKPKPKRFHSRRLAGRGRGRGGGRPRRATPALSME